MEDGEGLGKIVYGRGSFYMLICQLFTFQLNFLHSVTSSSKIIFAGPTLDCNSQMLALSFESKSFAYTDVW